MVVKLTASVCIFILSLASNIALGNDDVAWSSGLAAYQDGDYSTALSAFETALASGQSGPAVQYNIGVCQYQIGLYDEAAETFVLISQKYPKMRALAEYNRGLVAHKQGKTQSAERLFLSTYRLSTDDAKLRILASTMLRRIESETKRAVAWAGALGANAGYDDNIVLRDEVGLPIDVTADSGFVDTYGTISGPIHGLRGVNFDGDAYLISYFDNSDFNQSGLNAGLSYNWTGEIWKARVGANAGYSTFGGDAFDDSRNLDIRLTRSLSAYSSIEFRYRFADISAAVPLFAGIDGSQQRMAIKYRWNQGGRRFDIAYTIERNNRDDPGVSPDRDRLRLTYRYDLSSSWTAELGGDFRVSRYGELSPERTEDRVILKTGISRLFRSGWRALAQYQHSTNSSTDDTYSYTRNQVNLGLMKLF